MSTVREKFGLACPKCGRDDRLRIWAYAMVAMTPDGSVETNDPFHEWGPDHYCECEACGHQGIVSDFATNDRANEVAP